MHTGWVGRIRIPWGHLSCGVPQGTILGPTLFLCYVNDMQICLKCRLALYADDSALIACGTDSAQVANILSRELVSCQNWLIDNRLSLHMGKTECILFGTGRCLGKAGEFHVRCGDSVVDRVKSVKYLGVLLDERLDFYEHVFALTKKAASRLSFLHRYSSL